MYFQNPILQALWEKMIIMGFTCFMITWYIFTMFTIYSQLKSFKILPSYSEYFQNYTPSKYIGGVCNLESVYLPHFLNRILTHHKNSEVQDMHRKFPEWKTHLSTSTTLMSLRWWKLNENFHMLCLGLNSHLFYKHPGCRCLFLLLCHRLWVAAVLLLKRWYRMKKITWKRADFNFRT